MTDPCLGMCFGHGVCTYRQCTCGVAVVNNVTLPWLLPWCEFCMDHFNHFFHTHTHTYIHTHVVLCCVVLCCLV
jgi:hypothetical protein